MSKKTFEEKINKFLNSEDFYRFIMLSVGVKKELAFEDRKGGKGKEFEKIIIELRTPKGYTHKLITRDTEGKFAICYNLQGKLAVAVEDESEYLGFEESNAKFMAIAIKDNKAVLFLYDSSMMKRVFILGVTDIKKVQNIGELFETLNDLGFCKGETKTYIGEGQENATMKTEAGNGNG